MATLKIELSSGSPTDDIFSVDVLVVYEQIHESDDVLLFFVQVEVRPVLRTRLRWNRHPNRSPMRFRRNRIRWLPYNQGEVYEKRQNNFSPISYDTRHFSDSNKNK